MSVEVGAGAPLTPALAPAHGGEGEKALIPARAGAAAATVDSWRLVVAGLVALDAVAVAAAFILAYIIRFQSGIPWLEVLPPNIRFYSTVAFWAIPAWVGLFAIYRLYDRQELFTGIHEYLRVFHAGTAGMLVMVMISFLDVSLQISRGWLLLTWFLSILLVTSGRFGMRRVLRWLRRSGRLCTPTLIVGANGEGRALAEQFAEDAGGGIAVVGFVDTSLPIGTRVTGDLPVLGGITHLEDLVRRLGVQEVIIATTALGRDELLDLYRTLGHDERVEVRMSSGLAEVLTTAVAVQERSGVALMTPQRMRIYGFDAMLKTSLDYVIAVSALVVLFPILLAIGLLVKLDSPGPILFRRRVLGRSGKTFDAFKFRTMVDNADQVLATNGALREAFDKNFKLKEDPRVTRLGRFLRRTSLDEVPQLLNVLRGEMSLVGPRMISPEEAKRFGKWQMNLVTVKPGITGPWQVRGRGDVPYETRVRLSMQYIRNYTIWLDLEILLRTLFVVLKGKGAY